LVSLPCFLWGITAEWAGQNLSLISSAYRHGNVGFTIAFGSCSGRFSSRPALLHADTKSRRLAATAAVINMILCNIRPLFINTFGSGVVIAIGIKHPSQFVCVGLPKPLADVSF
jgi:hypothetical protein